MTNETQGIILWHASRADVERPTIAGRTQGSNHANSGLGIYCAAGPHDYISGFGDAIHELMIRSDARVTSMSVRELHDMGEDYMAGDQDGPVRDRAWFDAEGRRLARDHDVVLIRESNGYASQAIILNDDAVASSIRLTREEFAAKSRDVLADVRAHDELGREAYGRVRPRGPTPSPIRAPERARGR